GGGSTSTISGRNLLVPGGGWHFRRSWNGEAADLPLVGEGCRHREEGSAQGSRFLLERGRVWATEVLVPRCTSSPLPGPAETGRRHGWQDLKRRRSRSNAASPAAAGARAF